MTPTRVPCPGCGDYHRGAAEAHIRSDEQRPGEPESGTLLHLSDACPLCGYEPLNPSWDPNGPRKCSNCEASIGGGR